MVKGASSGRDVALQVVAKSAIQLSYILNVTLYGCYPPKKIICFQEN
jgi:hypothetical protein